MAVLTGRVRGVSRHCNGKTELRKGGTWHDLPLWEVACEEIVIGSDVLIANGILLRLRA